MAMVLSDLFDRPHDNIMDFPLGEAWTENGFDDIIEIPCDTPDHSTASTSPPSFHFLSMGQRRPSNTEITSTKNLGIQSQHLLGETGMRTLSSCTHCPQTFSDGSELRRHIRTHKLNRCDQCSRMFGRQADMKRHMMEVHLKQKIFVCPVESCARHKKGFQRRNNLEAHVRNIHQVDQDGTLLDVDLKCIEASQNHHGPSSAGGRPECTEQSPETIAALRKEPKSSEKIRRGIRSELSALQLQRKKMDKVMSRLEEQIAMLNQALEGLDRK